MRISPRCKVASGRRFSRENFQNPRNSIPTPPPMEKDKYFCSDPVFRMLSVHTHETVPAVISCLNAQDVTARRVSTLLCENKVQTKENCKAKPSHVRQAPDLHKCVWDKSNCETSSTSSCISISTNTSFFVVLQGNHV